MSDASAGAPAHSPGEERDPIAMIEAWRERGADRFDPVRFRFIEAMARRTAAHDGPVGQVLRARVAQLLADYADALDRARCAPGETGGCDPASSGACTPAYATRGPLAELVDYIAGQPPAHADERAAGNVAHGVGGPVAELKTLRYFRSTWSRLSAHQRLTQSLAQVPTNAGPLNSQHLVHRALTLMRDASPEYLNRFISYVDTLLWLDQASGGGVLERKDVPRSDGERKGRSRSA
jgi:hypothetical protein